MDCPFHYKELKGLLTGQANDRPALELSELRKKIATDIYTWLVAGLMCIHLSSWLPVAENSSEKLDPATHDAQMQQHG